ncbi:MAG: hypothetical protein NVSMB6_15940 [Burkholderiaceae bacterium]
MAQPASGAPGRPIESGDAVEHLVDANGSPWLVYICNACGLLYDERVGDADSGLAPGTRFADIPDNWACPLCGVRKEDFVLYRKVDAAPLLCATAQDDGRAGDRPGRVCATGVTGVGGATTSRSLRLHGAGVVIVGAGHAG